MPWLGRLGGCDRDVIQCRAVISGMEFEMIVMLLQYLDHVSTSPPASGGWPPIDSPETHRQSAGNLTMLNTNNASLTECFHCSQPWTFHLHEKLLFASQSRYMHTCLSALSRYGPRSLAWMMPPGASSQCWIPTMYVSLDGQASAPHILGTNGQLATS